MAKKKVNKGGRPTVMTPEVIGKLEQAFAIDASVEEACSFADISRDAFYDYLKKDPKYSDRIAALREKPILKARNTVVAKIGDSYANAMDYLSRKRKSEFATRSEITGNEGGPIKVDIQEQLAKVYGIGSSAITLSSDGEGG
jgi:mevalonate kinase